MQSQLALPVALVLFNAAGALGKAAAPTPDPLHQFINGVQNGANAINSGLSAQSAATASSTSSPTSSSTSPTAAPATSSAAAHHGLSNGAKIGIIVGCVIAAVLLIGILLGICCCLMLRKRRRSKRVKTSVAEDEKAWQSKPINPGRNYSPVSSHGRHHSMEQHPTVPLMAAGAIPHGTHSQAPSLSQHPAMRNTTHENPFADNAGGTHHNSHHGLEAGLAGATAAGAAGYGLHHHHQGGQNHPTSNAQMTPATHNVSNLHNGPKSHHGLESGLVGATAGGLAGHGMRDHHDDGTYKPFSTQGLPPASHGLPPAVATSAISGSGAGYGTSHNTEIAHPSSVVPHSNIRNEGFNHHHGLTSHSGTTPSSGLNTLPSSSHPASNSHNGLKAGAGGAAIAGATAYGVHRHEEKKRNQSRSRSRSNSRPRSGGLPTRNDADRPPTPFGLSGIGKPYEDMHVHVLQSEAPSNELQRSLQSREGQFAGGPLNSSEHPKSRNSRGYSTPPQVPSRSPNRISTFADNSADSTSSNSGGEQYNQGNDPYQPAHPHRSYVAPWEQHQTRYSGTPPTSATMTPPPVPWESQEYAQHQRGQNHSPRQSIDASGRRSSRSPATSINGQPRRLRFEDLQPASGSGNARYSGQGPYSSHDEYDHARWSQGVGEAM